MHSPSVRYARTADGLHIAYQAVGDGPFDLVYAPAWISNLEVLWDMPDLGEFLWHLASFSRLIVLDRRGSGLSDRPFRPDSLSLEVGMDDIRAVMDAASSDRAALFGVEDGGALSALFAASYPGRVLALVLFGVWAKYYASPDYPWGWTHERSEEWWRLVERDWGTDAFWMQGGGGIVSPRIQADAERVEAWARFSRLSASPGAALAIERMQRDTDIRAVLPTVHVPTLVMHRTADTWEQVEQARYIGERIVGAKVVELPGDEHAPFAGDAGRVLRELEDFISSIRDEEADFDRVLATVLFTDLVGSTERAEALGDRGWREVVERHHAAVRGLLVRYRA